MPTKKSSARKPAGALPAFAGKIAKCHPAVWKAHAALGKAASDAGPLNAAQRRLVKLALAIGARHEGATHSHARQALAEGMSADTMRHVALLAAPTLGFPAAAAALSWIEDVVAADD